MATLSPPPPDLRRFPRRTLRATTDLFRVHPRGLGPWWFASEGAGRFDLSPPEGTCYLARSPLGSFVEVFRDFRVVAEADVVARVLSRLRVATDAVLADCTSPRALAFGVTAAVHSTPDYETTRGWAAALHRHGHAGIRYFCGHDPSQREVGVALFGAAGEARWPVVETGAVGDDVIRAVERRFGIWVLPAPVQRGRGEHSESTGV